MKLSLLWVPAVVLIAGCAGGYVVTGDGTVTTGAYVEDDVGPGTVDVETYPRAYVDGGYVYQVNGRYYRRNGSHWYRYRARPRGAEFRAGPRGGREHVQQHEERREERHERR